MVLELMQGLLGQRPSGYLSTREKRRILEVREIKQRGTSTSMAKGSVNGYFHPGIAGSWVLSFLQLEVSLKRDETPR